MNVEHSHHCVVNKTRIPDIFQKVFEQDYPDILDPEKNKSIFYYYDIPNEVDFINNNNLSIEQKKYYLRENVFRFLGEFAGKVPYARITYVLRGDGLYYGNIRALDNFRKTAQTAGATSREIAEAEGFEQVENSFLRPSTQLNELAATACWISPPKITNYGFVFYLVKDEHYDENLKGHRVTEYILRYPEKMGEVSKSNQILNHFNKQPDPDYKKSPDDFLTSPVVHNPKDTSHELNEILTLVDITDREIELSALFETQVKNHLSEWIEMYVKMIFALSRLSPDSSEYNQHFSEAQRLLTTIFNRAKEIKHIVEEPQNYLAVEQAFLDANQDVIMFHYADQQPAEVQGGGSCPTIKKRGKENKFLSSIDIYSLIDGGMSIEQYIAGENSIKEYLNGGSSEYYESYRCENKKCGEMIPGEKKGSHPLTWRTNCPHCNVEIRGCR